jgi:hypothetical protein
MKPLAVLLIAWSSFAAEKYTIGGKPVFWREPPVVEALGPKKFQSALNEAAAFWKLQTVGSPKVTVEWVNDWPFAQSTAAITTFSTIENEIVSAHVIVNGKSIIWTQRGKMWGFSFRKWKWKCNLVAVLKHELGHVLGYKHSEEEFDTMYAGGG